MRGFTLVEAMVSLALLVVVMVVSLTLLFTMRSFAERVTIVIEPRQTARRAVDYLAHFLQGATDVGVGAQNAIVTYYNSDASNSASRVQATYDNLTGSEPGNSILAPGQTAFGDAGTDVISLLIPTGQPAKYQLFPNWLGYSIPMPKDYYVGFKGGCGGAANDDAANMAAFKALTGENGLGGGSNALLLVQDNLNVWQYFRIKAYVPAAPPGDGCIAMNGWNVHIQTEPGTAPPPGGAGPIDPPGGHPGTMNDPVMLVTGLEAVSFRVRTVNGVPTLQQKAGLFDPTTDNPGTAFVPIIENVEDFQVSYLYPDGTFWQTANATYDLKTYTAPAAGPTPTPGGPAPTPVPADCNGQCVDDVPWQAGPTAAAPARDITQVIGLRFTIVARSRPVTFGARQMARASLRFRPAVENNTTAGAPDDFEHYRATVTIMLKNRMLGS
ncbi:MAG: prepilin-type N-terminal cleavage/methylation domain-containing protein [Thermoanaerobaculia bacterium]